MQQLEEQTVIKITQQSLMEQIGLNRREIARRLHMFNFTEEDRQALLAAEETIEEQLIPIADAYYSVILEDPEISLIIGDADTLNRLNVKMRSYIINIFRGRYDEQYVNGRLRIGKVHKRIGVTPKLYMSAISKLQLILDDVCENSEAIGEAEATRTAIHKMLLFDAQLVFEAYVDSFLAEADAAREQVDKYAVNLELKVDTLTRRLHEQSKRDELTKLYNHRAFYDFLDRELRVAKRHQLPLCLAYFDLNNFKTVNDQHGHRTGDGVLAEIGENILGAIRDVDIACRYGGDEFCLIMPRSNIEEAQQPLNRLIENFDMEKHHGVSFSIGLIEVQSGEDCDSDTLVRAADKLMYQAKNLSRNQPGHKLLTQIGVATQSA